MVSTMFPMQMACDVCAFVCVCFNAMAKLQAIKQFSANISSENVIDKLVGKRRRKRKKLRIRISTKIISKYVWNDDDDQQCRIVERWNGKDGNFQIRYDATICCFRDGIVFKIVAINGCRDSFACKIVSVFFAAHHISSIEFALLELEGKRSVKMLLNDWECRPFAIEFIFHYNNFIFQSW